MALRLTRRRRAAAEIDELWERKIPAWRWAKTETVIEQQMHAVVEVDRVKRQTEHLEQVDEK